MIKIGSNDLTLKLGSANVSAAYLGATQVYGGGGYDLCYGVADDISTYSARTFADVFDKTSGKWYKLNNLQQYEEYGVYGSGRTITTYTGKLTIDDGYEYKYTGGTWVNIGAVSGSTAELPDVPFSLNFNAKEYDSTTKTFAKTTGQLVDTDAVVYGNTPVAHDDYVTVNGGTYAPFTGYQTYINRSSASPNLTVISKQRTADATNCHLFGNRSGSSDYNWMYRPTSTKLAFHGSSQINGTNTTTQPVIESVRVDSSRVIKFDNYTDNTTTSAASFSYGSSQSSGCALFCGYSTGSTTEQFSGDFYWIYVSQNTLTDEEVQQVIDYNENGSSTEYPEYYDDKADPADNLTFNTLEEAEAYALVNCVYDGMRAIIAGSRYVFDSEEGWEKVQKYYSLTDVTPAGASGWTITGSATYNPDDTYYDDFSLECTSNTNITRIAKVTIYGYDSFTYYLRSYAYNNYAYVYATYIDELVTDPTTNFGYNSSSAITNTYSWNKTPGSQVTTGNYRRVTYTGLDTTVEHTFYVVFYGLSYVYQPNATILIPKSQDNENWEEVMFSATTNVGSANKGLLLDNDPIAGVINNFFYRYVVGLPAGAHSAYCTYTNYNYCPSAITESFTSVAGQSRTVDFTFEAGYERTLSFRLVDTSGNTLTSSDLIHYLFTRYNACGVASQSVDYTVPVTITVKTGGSFSLSTTGNKQYIYGYTPPNLVSRYYVDDYQTYFDLVYTKLDEEAVTITYTTFDPNDTEIPSFATDITYPYNGGTTSATTLQAFDVPYGYSYSTNVTSNMFSASPITNTAGQASRTVTFTLYPNNRDFATVTDLEAYGYPWEGMKATVAQTDRYKYQNGQWSLITVTEYEYIQTEGASGKTYDFLTGFYPLTSHTIETKIEFRTVSVDWGSIICWVGGGNTNFTFESVTKNYQFIVRTDGSTGTNNRPTIGANNVVTVRLPLSGQSGTYQVEGGSVTTLGYNYSPMTLPSSMPMTLFGKGNQTRRNAASARMYYTKVFDEYGNLVKHYVASDYDGVPCFYEKVDGEYVLDTYTGSDHGTCTLGNPVS